MSKQLRTYDSEMHRLCLSKSVPDCKWNSYDYWGSNDDDESDECFAYSKRTGNIHMPIVATHSPILTPSELEMCDTDKDAQPVIEQQSN